MEDSYLLGLHASGQIISKPTMRPFLVELIMFSRRRTCLTEFRRGEARYFCGADDGSDEMNADFLPGADVADPTQLRSGVLVELCAGCPRRTRRHGARIGE